ncbi:MAG: porphobilinogen synthase [Planctomycetota bacterium]
MPDSTGDFPTTRLRRMRSDDWARRMVRETTVSADNLIWPVFVREGTNQREAVPSLPGVHRLSIDLLVAAAREAADLGIPCLAVFPVVDPSLKTPGGEEACNGDNLVCRAVRELKAQVPQIGVMTDVALDLYTTHGHDGVLRDHRVDNDATIAVLVEQARVQAAAGCDILGPSDMMDGRVGAIRRMLEADGRHLTKIMSYAAKYASALYGPYRDAVGSKSNLGAAGKHSYQQDPANTDEALREVEMDIREGADMVMVKPGTFYLDIVRRIRERFAVPLFAYHVSGEYAMIRAAAANGWIDGDRVMLEAMVSFRRAGCSGVLTYAALDLARAMAGG